MTLASAGVVDLPDVLCPSCGEGNIERARYCIACGSPMVVDSGERRIVTVTFTDARGFIDLTERSPDLARSCADAIAARAQAIVEAHGGVIDKVISENGFKVMAIFGAPVAHEDDALRAVRASMSLHDDLWASRDLAGVRLATGIMTGEAIYAPIGPSGDRTVLGDTVNTAARLCSAAAAGEVVIGAATHGAVSSVMGLAPLPPVLAKGKVEPIAAWRVTGEGKAIEQRPRRAVIGRRAEHGVLDEAWEGVRRTHRRRSVVLIGEAGLGKSTIVGSFRRQQASRALTGHCLPYGEGITYWPVTELISQAASILRDDDPATVSGKLGTLLEELRIDDLDQLRTIAVAVANVVAAPTTPRGTYRAREVSRAELHWGLRRLFELLAAREPLLLVFEDLHWAEDTLLGFIEYLTDGTEPAALLVVGTARPALADAMPPLLDPRMHRRVLALKPLSADEGEAMLAELLGGPVPDTCAPLLAASGGNPLYLEELVRMLMDRGAVGPGRTADLTALAVPTSLHGLIESRLDQLPKDERAAAGHASVVGRVFWSGAVERIAGSEQRAPLRSLSTRQITFRNPSSTLAGEEEYSFTHLMLRDVSYGRIPKVDRSVLHERCAGWIASLPGSRDEYIEFVAYHLEQSCRLLRDVAGSRVRPPTLAAVDALMRAARKAENREGTHEADRYYERAFEILDEGYPETKTALRLHRSDTRALLGDITGAVELLRTVASDAVALDRPDLRCRALLQLANLVATSSVPEARAALDEAEAIATELDDERMRVTCSLASGFLRAIYEGHPEQGIHEMEEALDLAILLGEPGLLIAAHQRLANLSMNAGRLDQAEHHFRLSAELARAEGSVRDETEATRFLATIAYLRGPREEAEGLARQALVWLERNPNRIVEIQTRSRLAWIAVARGDLDEADRSIAAARALAEPIGGWMLVEVLRNQTAVRCLQRRLDEADEAARAAERAVPAGDPYAEGVAGLARAFVASARRDERAARDAFDRSLPLLAGEPLDEGLAHLWCGRALRSFGDHTGSQTHLAAARAIYAAMGATAMVADIDAEG